MDQCPVKISTTWPVTVRDTFCKLWESKIYKPEKPYELVNNGVLTAATDPIVPLAFIMDTSKYFYHPTEVYADGKFLGTIDQFKSNKMVHVKRVESVGNGDQGAATAEGAQHGNLYMVTRAGNCEDRSFEVGATRNLRDFPDTNNFLSYLVNLHGIQLTRGADTRLGPIADVRADKTGTAIVTVLPGAYGTHAPDDPESIRKGYTTKQGEWALAWSAVTYSAPKASIPLGAANLPTALRGAQQFCTAIKQAHSNSTHIMQFTWTPAEVAKSGGLTVAHDITRYDHVLRGAEALAAPALFKITLE